MSKTSDSAFLAAQHVAEAASAPAVKVSALGTSLVGLGDWLSTGPGMATAIGLCLTLASFMLQLWSVALRQRQPGDSLLDTIVRPFGAGGPGPRR